MYLNTPHIYPQKQEETQKFWNEKPDKKETLLLSNYIYIYS